MFSPEELLERRKSVGASEVPAILGVDAWKSPLRTYSEKLGLVDADPDSEAAEAGRVLEEPIAQWYAKRVGATLSPSPTVVHPDHPWVTATPDRNSARPDRPVPGILEVKNRNEYAKDDFGEEDSDELPLPIVAQVTWQMMVRDVQWADVAVLIGGNKLRIYTVYRDRWLEGRVFAKVEAFWFGNVQAQVPPAATALDNEGMKQLFPKQMRPLKDGTPELLETLLRLGEVKASQKEDQVLRDEYEAHLKLAIADGEGLTWPNGAKVTWKNNKDTEVVDFEAAALKLSARLATPTQTADAILAEVVESCLKVRPGPRVLRTTLPKEG